tara:strand:+ start:511 stop:936 length:426 start_codon:yes stop_codon:yes gene_type:complete
MLRIYLLIVVFGIVGGAVYGAKYYYNTTQNTIAALRENNAKLETAVQISEDSVKMLQQDIVKNAELNAELQKELQTAELYGDELRATLNKHNLTHLANKKPGLIEKRMQNATDKLWDDLTAITDPDGVQQSDAGTKDNNGN